MILCIIPPWNHGDGWIDENVLGNENDLGLERQVAGPNASHGYSPGVSCV